MSLEVAIDSLEEKGYVVRIGGGNDKQGFPMKQGVLTNGRVRLLLKKGQSCKDDIRSLFNGSLVGTSLLVINETDARCVAARVRPQMELRGNLLTFVYITRVSFEHKDFRSTCMQDLDSLFDQTMCLHQQKLRALGL